MEKAIKINAAAKDLWGVAAMKSHLSILVYNTQGKVNLGFKGSDEAVRIAERGGDIIFESNRIHLPRSVYVIEGSLEDAKKNLFMGANLCEGRIFFYGMLQHTRS